MLGNDTALRELWGVYALPTIVVNEFIVHGNIDCDVLTVDTCGALDAICAGFINGTEPSICDRHISKCDDIYKDCYGVCHGTAQYDRCHNCTYPSQPNWNACVGCDNVAFSDKVMSRCH